MIDKSSSIIQVLLDINRLETFIENNYFSISNLPGFDIEQSLASFDEWSYSYFHKFYLIFQRFPWLVSFPNRFKLFKHAVLLQDNFIDDKGNVIFCRIRRNNMIEDGLKVLTFMIRNDAHMRSKFKITFIDETGHEEPGIDDGGLFKEFLLQVLKTLLNPEYGLYLPINGDELIPNYQAGIFVEGNLSVLQNNFYL